MKVYVLLAATLLVGCSEKRTIPYLVPSKAKDYWPVREVELKDGYVRQPRTDMVAGFYTPDSSGDETGQDVSECLPSYMRINNTKGGIVLELLTVMEFQNEADKFERIRLWVDRRHAVEVSTDDLLGIRAALSREKENESKESTQIYPAPETTRPVRVVAIKMKDGKRCWAVLLLRETLKPNFPQRPEPIILDKVGVERLIAAASDTIQARTRFETR